MRRRAPGRGPTAPRCRGDAGDETPSSRPGAVEGPKGGVLPGLLRGASRAIWRRLSRGGALQPGMMWPTSSPRFPPAKVLATTGQRISSRGQGELQPRRSNAVDGATPVTLHPRDSLANRERAGRRWSSQLNLLGDWRRGASYDLLRNVLSTSPGGKRAILRGPAALRPRGISSWEAPRPPSARRGLAHVQLGRPSLSAEVTVTQDSSNFGRRRPGPCALMQTSGPR